MENEEFNRLCQEKPTEACSLIVAECVKILPVFLTHPWNTKALLAALDKTADMCQILASYFRED